MRKTLAQQLIAFMDEEKCTSQQVADRVRAVQAKAGAKKTVTRQNIEGVLAGIARPRYLPELAVAMGTDVETLRLGRYGMAPSEPKDGNQDGTGSPGLDEAGEIELALAVLAKALLKADKSTRKSVQPSLSSLAIEPEDLQSISRVVVRLLVAPSSSESKTHDRPKGEMFRLDRGIGPDGQSDPTAEKRRKTK